MFGSPMTLVKVSPPDWKGWEGAAWQLGTKIPNFGLHVVLSTINDPKTSPNSMAEGFLGLDGSDLRFHQVKPGSISIHFPHWAAPTTHPCFLCHGRMPCSKQTCWGFADLTSIPGYIVNDTSTPAQPILTSPGLTSPGLTSPGLTSPGVQVATTSGPVFIWRNRNRGPR